MSSSLYVVFTQDVPQVAEKNTLRRVKRGYFRNFLFPKSFATLATPDLLERLKGQIAEKKLEAQMSQATLSEQAKKLLGKTVKLQAKASAKGTLFRAISEKALVDALKDQTGVTLEKSQLEHEPIKRVGSHSVTVKIGEESMKISVMVEAKAEEKS